MTQRVFEQYNKEYNGSFLTIILDPAHGEDVKGRCSPDGVHNEYIWSRQRCKELEVSLTQLGYEVYYSSQAIKEIGLSKRKTNANNIPIKPGKVKLLISPHNNASGSDGKWHDATGVEIWTSKGKTNSDIFSSIMYSRLKHIFPELKFRPGSRDPRDPDKDENFTVLLGNYQAMLIEWLFQDGKEDIGKLLDSEYNSQFVRAVTLGIEDINSYIVNQLKKSAYVCTGKVS